MRAKIKRELTLTYRMDRRITDVGEQPHKTRLASAAGRHDWMTESG
jgi:hypothetical protein